MEFKTNHFSILVGDENITRFGRECCHVCKISGQVHKIIVKCKLAMFRVQSLHLNSVQKRFYQIRKEKKLGPLCQEITVFKVFILGGYNILFTKNSFQFYGKAFVDL